VLVTKTNFDVASGFLPLRGTDLITICPSQTFGGENLR